ncbi:MAG: type I polyketide synthase [Planctomycetota bacterium]|jgi:acyl transferase domain-containing protein/acyl carrier protein
MDRVEDLEAVAVIGMNGRFPGARNIDEFWSNLCSGVESISRFTAADLESDGVDPAVMTYPGYVNAGGILEDIDLFDPAFFGYSPREVEILDPQQRLFLECAWEIFESAGYDPQAYDGLVGVFAGVTMSKYLFNILSNPKLVNLLGHYQITLGNDKDYIATRTAYKLNLKGPAVTVQTACSTSLVAVCLACQNLLNYSCDIALAGGSTIDIPQKRGYLYQEGSIYSPDGHCRAFDALARGTVAGNGVAMVLLKRLSDAIEDSDSIHAVILGSAINNDGSQKVGYTAPSVNGQAQVIAMAQMEAGVDPETITYIETHGTGTPLGDPIEIAALTNVFQATTEKKSFCALGSVKTNVGHLDSAAGATGLIKAILALKHKLIPPSLNFEKPNPKINFGDSPFYVNVDLKQWEIDSGIRRAGVSSFGIGGTNAHVVLEEAPEMTTDASQRPWQILVVSARTSNALDKMTSNLGRHFAEQPEQNLADIAYTLQTGRHPFDLRRIVVCKDVSDAAATLDLMDPRRVISGLPQVPEPKVAFLFTGQGSQYANMALELYEGDRVFRETVDECATALQTYLGFDIRTVIYPEQEGVQAAEEKLSQTAITQPALFVIEYALARLWMTWGIQPQAMIGHSLGEYTAACLAGVFSLPDALAIVAERGKLMQEMVPGAMLAVMLPETQVSPLLNGQLSLAVINAPQLCVLAGTFEAIDQLEAQLNKDGVFCRRLRTSHAYHSALMEPALDPFSERVRSISLNPPTIPVISNVTGTWISAEQATSPNYWASHIRQTVRFAEGVGHLLDEPGMILLEVGPGRTLSTLVQRQVDRAQDRLVLYSLPHPKDQQSEMERVLKVLGQLWISGLKVDWDQLHAGERRHRIPLPTYPFERKRYWVEAPRQQKSSDSRTAPTGQDITDWLYVPSWQQTPILELPSPQEGEQNPQHWLLFVNQIGLGEKLVEKLRSRGDQVTQVVAGEHLARLDEHAYMIDPWQPAEYTALLNELRAADTTPTYVVHMWSTTQPEENQAERRSGPDNHHLGFYSLVFLAQAIGELASTDPIQIGIVSNHLQAVLGDELLDPEKATVLGPSKVIPQEYPHIRCQSIDVVLPPPGTSHEGRLVENLISEMLTETTDFAVAYRGNHRWVQRFERATVSEPTVNPIRLQEKGVYLITGGLGGIGLVLAEHFARTVQARLVLIGRSALPPREEWSLWREKHGSEDRTSQKLAKIQTLEALGAEVKVINSDVTDRERMQTVLDEVREQYGELHGVIHAAGIAGGGIIQLKTPEMASRVMAPKITGTWVLDEALGDRPLDFFILCSSLASILGGAGQVDYCAANNFLDAFAHARSAGDRPVISINWDRWQEVGMAVETQAPPDLQRQLLEGSWRGIRPTEGVKVFDQTLQLGRKQVAVSTFDLLALLKASSSLRGDGSGRQTDLRRPSQTMYERPELSNEYLAPQTDCERLIVDLFETLLGIKPIGIHDNFFELGGHSLLAIQLITRMREAFQTELSIQTLFDSQTVAELAAIIEEQEESAQRDVEEIVEMLEVVESLSEEEVKALLAGGTVSAEE